MAEIDEWRSVGVDDHELPDSAVAVLREADARGFVSKFAPGTKPLKFDTTVRFTR